MFKRAGEKDVMAARDGGTGDVADIDRMCDLRDAVEATAVDQGGRGVKAVYDFDGSLVIAARGITLAMRASRATRTRSFATRRLHCGATGWPPSSVSLPGSSRRGA
jgi:hypothetical protein